MKEYYLSQISIKETQLKMAQIGYTEAIKGLALKLLDCSIKESYEISKQIAEAVAAYRELEKEHSWNLKRYQEEALKGIGEK